MKLKLYLLLVFLNQFLSFAQTGNVLNFDGTNDQVNLGNSLSSEIDPLNTITVEAWVYPTQLTSYNGLIVGNYAYPTDNGQLQFALRRDGTSYNFFVNDGPSIKGVSAPSSVNLNTWTHIAGVWDGSEIRIYINGVLQGTTSGVTGTSFVSLANSFAIGFSLAGAPDEAFRGSIDEVRIWSSVRTQVQIDTNKANELNMPQTGLLRYYKFNHGVPDANNSGITVLEDSSTNLNNGTLINFALNGTTSNWKGDSPVSGNASISGCWKNIYTGANQTYAIGNDGTLWSWGFNAEAQLGLGDASNRLVPTQIGTATNWKTLSSGDRHVLALREDGTLWVWGRNTQGHLGLGDTSQRNVPTQLGTANDWDKIDCGANTSLAIKTDGTLWVWGGNNEGQLGLGDLTQRLVPTQIGTDTDWIDINGAGQSTYAIKSNGTLWGTGANTDGQLGLGDNTQRLSFVQIGTDTNWSKVHVGFGAFALAQKVDGSLWGTGNNQFGQLGQNNTTNLNVFTQIGTATDWNKFTTASSHSMAIKNDGTLYTWGRNTNGQLGLGDNTNRLVPTQVGAATNWYDVTGGDGFLIALNIVGEIWSTGNNWAGQLGLGDITNRNSPVQIACPAVLSSDDFMTENNIVIYPNPSNGIFNIASQEESLVTVYDMIGKKLLSIKVSIGSSNLDLSNYANGIYLLTVTNQNGGLKTFKLIKR